MEISIEQLRSPGDLSACASMMATSPPWSRLYFTKDQCESNLGHPAVALHVALAPDGTIAGFLASMASGMGSEPMIEYLCVAEDARNAGIGSALIRFFEDTLFPDADNLYLFVSDINPDAARLYLRLGYVPAGALSDFNLKAQTEFLYRKTRRPRQEARALVADRATDVPRGAA
jgi:ribosomal protein S18 acetylase RimI-like enzyme